MHPLNHPASPDSFEHSRLDDLVALHQAIVAVGQAPDCAAVIAQQTVLYDRLNELLPTMISEHEFAMYNEQFQAMADLRKETLGCEGKSH
jgi:hypothetical protein